MIRLPLRSRPVRKLRNSLISLIVLCLVGSSVEASEPHVSVDAGQIRDAITERISSVHAVEVKLKDNSAVIGKLGSAEDDGLRVIVGIRPTSARAIPYTQVASIRIDLGARSGWQITGGVLGALTGAAVGAFITQESSNSAYRTAGFLGMGVGAFVGTKLAGRHRKILVIDVK